MSSFSIGLTMFGAMLVLMAVRVPIAVAMFVPGALGYLALSGWLPLLAHLGRARHHDRDHRLRHRPGPPGAADDDHR